MAYRRCQVDSHGRLYGGPIAITWNSPWPCVNGQPGFTEPALGVVLHTEDGSEAGTQSWFNNGAAQVSAFFSVSFSGAVHQYGPLAGGWMAWSQADGNSRWIGIEHEDDSDPSRPFSDAQVNATAYIVEALSRHFGFPLAAAYDPFTERGVTLHSEGGAAFGGHYECPGTVRGAQRPDIITRAKAIRNPPDPAPEPAAWKDDPMLLDTVGVTVPLSIPSGAKHLVLTPLESGSVTVQLLDHGTQAFVLAKQPHGGAVVAVPSGVQHGWLTLTADGPVSVCVD
jgi:hypothetical protein